MVVFAGLLGPSAVGGFQIAFNLVGIVFMCALGASTAASVRVAQAIGRRDPGSVARAGWVAVGLLAAVDVAAGGVFLGLPEALAGLYSEDPGVLAAAVPAIAIAGLVLAADGAQATLIGALRGTGDVWVPSGLFLLAFWGVMVPLGYLLGVRQDGGPAGLMTAVLAGCLVATVLLGLRFRRIGERLAAVAAPVEPLAPVAVATPSQVP
jgi:MATE family multidrug resistance protein